MFLSVSIRTKYFLLCVFTFISCVVIAEDFLNPPHNIKLIRASYTKITIAWDAGENNTTQISGYKIYRNSQEIATVPNTTYTDIDLQKGTPYRYKVAAVSVGGEISAFSRELHASTMKAADIDNHETVEAVVDIMHDTKPVDLTALSLISAVKSAFESLLGTNVTFTTIDSDILSSFVVEELSYIKEAAPEMTEAERIAVQNEIDNMMLTDYGGESFEQLYIHTQLDSLAEKHWAAGHKNAALMLFELSLNYLKDDQKTVFNTLSRMAMLHKFDITDQDSNAKIAEKLLTAKDYYLRFPTHFTNPDVNFLKTCYSMPAAWFFNHFPKLLAYDTYNEHFFSVALELSRKNAELKKNDPLATRLFEKISAWELINVTVNVQNNAGNARNATLKIKNISGISGKEYLYPNDEVFLDERIISITDGQATVPVYAGHIYDMSVTFPVSGGNSLVYSIPLFAHEKGKSYQYNTVDEPVMTSSADGKTSANFIVAQQPQFPYNLSFERNIDVFSLSWDWTAPSSFELDHFKIFRGNIPIATVKEKTATRLPLDNPNGVYSYRVVAYDKNGMASAPSQTLTIIPGDQSVYGAFFDWMKTYFGDQAVFSCDDPDGDGIDNYHEFLNGTDPTKIPGPTPYPGSRGYTKLTLAWEPTGNNTEAGIYKISRNGVEIGSSSTCSFIDTDLTPGLIYSYKIRREEPNNMGTDWSIATPMSTQKPERFDYSDKVQKVVDSFIPLIASEYTGSSLVSAVKSAFEALFGTNITFTVINRNILEEMVEQELAVLREVTPPMTVTERLAMRNEIQQMMDENWGGNSFEHMYIHSKLEELAEKHWGEYLNNKNITSNKIAAEALYNSALYFLTDHQPSVYGALRRLARFQLDELDEQSTEQDIFTRVNNHRDILLRFFDYFESVGEQLGGGNPFKESLAIYVRYFPKLLKYSSYNEDFFNHALQLATAWINKDANETSLTTLNNVSAWKLTQLNISALTSQGSQASGEIILKNISPLIGDAQDIRTFILGDSLSSIPVYAGHTYKITVNTPVPGGPAWKQTIDNVVFGSGKKLIYDQFNGVTWQNLPEGNENAELALSFDAPQFPYNLNASLYPDVFKLSWDWVSPENYQLKYFNVYRGTTLLGTTANQYFENIPRVVTADNVYSYAVSAVDSNGNETRLSPKIQVLPNFTDEELRYFEWKKKYFGDAPSLATDDPDNDGLTNYQEFLLGSNPTQAPQADPKNTIETIIPGAIVKYYAGSFSAMPNFNALTPYKSEVRTAINFGDTQENILNSEKSDAVAMVVTAYFDVIEDGVYRFYLVNDDGACLYIDNAPLIDHGKVGWRDGYAELTLKKGTHAFRLEYYDRTDRAAMQVTWAGPNFSRKPIQTAFWHTTDDEKVLAEVVAWQKDSDFDGVTDLEERKHGTDPYQSDTDGDGLTDYEEIYIYLTNPLKVDTDGDGVSDHEEIKIAFSNPLVADFDGTRTVIQEIKGRDYASASANWEKFGDGVICTAHNGSIAYRINVPAKGVYVLEITGGEQQEFRKESEFLLSLNVNGQKCGTQTMKSLERESSTVRFFLPELPAGTALLNLKWENVLSNTALRIDSLQLVALGGPDTNQNGMADWIDHRLENISQTEIARTSRTSPLYLEGNNAADISAAFITVQGEKAGQITIPWTNGNQILWLSESPTDEQLLEFVKVVPEIKEGARNTYYADVPLSPDGATTVTVKNSDKVTVTQNVTWVPTNVLNDPDMTIRRGDSLLLKADFGENISGTGTITVNNEQLTTANASAVPYQFKQAGTYTVTAEFIPADGSAAATGELVVKVVDASFNGAPYAIVNLERNWNNANIPAEIQLDYDEEHITVFRADNTSGCNIAFYGKIAGKTCMTARLGVNGPVVASTMISILDSSTHKNDGYYKVIDTFPDGSRLIEGKIILTDVPEDLRIQLVISTAGTTFLDGTIKKWLTAADFDENGVCRYQMLKSPESSTSTCHSMNYYQGNDFLFSYRNW